jgi:hypothetical protein
MPFHDMSNAAVCGTIAAVQFRISELEKEQIRRAVSSHIQEELNYNAGLGGNSTPGRSQTRS